jgi:hypothetical protein
VRIDFCLISFYRLISIIQIEQQSMYKIIIIILVTSMQAFTQETHKLIFKGKTLQYEVQNPKASKQIIMIHGLGDAMGSFDKLCEQLPITLLNTIRAKLKTPKWTFWKV